MKKESILIGTAILIITNTIVKILSLVYRAVLVRLIGSEGLGLTEMITPVYSFLLVLSSLGIPLAISNMISRDINSRETKTIIKTGTIILAVTAALVTIITLTLFPFIKTLIFTDERTYGGFLVLVPTIAMITVVSVLRSYFQGSHQTSYIGKSQTIEQLTRVAIGCGVCYFLVAGKYSMFLILTGISVATFFAEAGGSLYLLVKYKQLMKYSKEKAGFSKEKAKYMIGQGLPITVSRLISSFTMSCQAVLIPKSLVMSGFSLSMAASLYGYLNGVAIVVLHLPMIITGALSLPLIPAIAEAAATKNTKLLHTRIQDSLAFTMFTAIPMISLLFFFATPICRILFDSPEAGPMLSLLCFGGIFLYLQQPVGSILQGLSCFNGLCVMMFISNGLYIFALLWAYYGGLITIDIIIYLLISFQAFSCIINVIYLKKKTGVKITPVHIFLKPLLSSFAGLFALTVLNSHLPQGMNETILAILLKALLFVVIYLFTLFLSGGIDKKTVQRMVKTIK